MTREDALAFLKRRGPLPEQPPLEGRTCLHAAMPYLCSCHLTLEQYAAASATASYTLYVFGQPIRGRVKVPFYPTRLAPSAGPRGDVVAATSSLELAAA